VAQPPPRSILDTLRGKSPGRPLRKPLTISALIAADGTDMRTAPSRQMSRRLQILTHQHRFRKHGLDQPVPRFVPIKCGRC